MPPRTCLLSRAPRITLAVLTLIAALVLGAALASERWGGLVPCALCLVERWPYRAMMALGVVGTLVPRLMRPMLAAFALAAMAGVVLGAIHVGVENRLWPSPLPECAAPRLSASTAAGQLAQLPARPSKACEDATYLIPLLPISMATMNLLASFGLAAAALTALRRERRP